MTTYPSINISQDIFLSEIRNITLSGTVKDGTVPKKRRVIAYRFPEFKVPYETFSDAGTGEWSIEVSANPNDRFIVFVLGESGQNAKIYDFITE